MILEDFQIKLTQLEDELIRIRRVMALNDHLHNGFDSTKITFSDISQRKVWLHHTIIGTAAATAANYAVFFIAPFACTVSEFREVHQTAGTDAGAVTLDLEKLTGTQALDAGTGLLQTTLSLKAAINTVQTATLTNTVSNRSLARGDRLTLKDAGVLTSVANVTTVTELILV